MINLKFWEQVNRDQAEYDQARRTILNQANQALLSSKQAIFAIHRADINEAKTKIDAAKQILQQLETDFAANKKLRSEGSWIAGVEEFVEANLLYQFVADESVGEITGLEIRPDEYIGGLSDYTGELLRRAVLLATERETEQVKIIANEIREVVNLLLANNLTGNLRNKFDQVKRNLQKIEHIMYELSLNS